MRVFWILAARGVLSQQYSALASIQAAWLNNSAITIDHTPPLLFNTSCTQSSSSTAGVLSTGPAFPNLNTISFISSKALEKASIDQLLVPNSTAALVYSISDNDLYLSATRQVYSMPFEDYQQYLLLFSSYSLQQNSSRIYMFKASECVLNSNSPSFWQIILISTISLTCFALVVSCMLHFIFKRHIPPIQEFDKMRLEFPPLSIESMKQFPTGSYSEIQESAKLDPIDSCVICLEEFDDEQVLRELPCKHYFHQICIDDWLTVKYSFCPLCKSSVDLINSFP